MSSLAARESRADAVPVRVIGIDPGLLRTGYACVELPAEEWSARLIEAGILRLRRGASLAYRLRQLEADLDEVLGELAPHALAVESVFTHSQNLRTAILMAHARGVVLLLAERRGVPIVEVQPTTVKKAATGNGHASKRQVQVAMMHEFALDTPPEPPDVADAIAIALAGSRRRERAAVTECGAASTRGRGGRDARRDSSPPPAGR